MKKEKAQESESTIAAREVRGLMDTVGEPLISHAGGPGLGPRESRGISPGALTQVHVKLPLCASLGHLPWIHLLSQGAFCPAAFSWVPRPSPRSSEGRLITSVVLPQFLRGSAPLPFKETPREGATRTLWGALRKKLLRLGW